MSSICDRNSNLIISSIHFFFCRNHKLDVKSKQRLYSWLYRIFLSFRNSWKSLHLCYIVCWYHVQHHQVMRQRWAGQLWLWHESQAEGYKGAVRVGRVFRKHEIWRQIFPQICGHKRVDNKNSNVTDEFMEQRSRAEGKGYMICKEKKKYILLFQPRKSFFLYKQNVLTYSYHLDSI